MKHWLIAAALLLTAAPAGAASLAPELEAAIGATDGSETLQVMITFIGGKPRAADLRELTAVTEQLQAMHGGRVIGAVLPAADVARLKRIRSVRTIELFKR